MELNKKLLLSSNHTIHIKPSSVQKLSDKTIDYKAQNFTSIINNPKFNILGDLKKKLSSNVNHVNLNISLKDLEKFSGANDSANSILSNNKSTPYLKRLNTVLTNNSQKSMPDVFLQDNYNVENNNYILNLDIKKYINSNYNDYFNKITKIYVEYKNNHSAIKYKGNANILSLVNSNNINSFINNKNKQSNSKQIFIRKNSETSEVSTSSSVTFKYEKVNEDQITKLVGKEFFVPESDYKINSKYLEASLLDVPKLSINLMEKSGYCEKEINKILTYSNIIYKYIIDHSYIATDISKSIKMIKDSKSRINITKQKYIDNSIKIIYYCNRKKKINQLKSDSIFLNKIFKISKEIDSIISSLNDSSNKYTDNSLFLDSTVVLGQNSTPDSNNSEYNTNSQELSFSNYTSNINNTINKQNVKKVINQSKNILLELESTSLENKSESNRIGYKLYDIIKCKINSLNSIVKEAMYSGIFKEIDKIFNKEFCFILDTYMEDKYNIDEHNNEKLINLFISDFFNNTSLAIFENKELIKEFNIKNIIVSLIKKLKLFENNLINDINDKLVKLSYESEIIEHCNSNTFDNINNLKNTVVKILYNKLILIKDSIHNLVFPFSLELESYPSDNKDINNIQQDTIQNIEETNDLDKIKLLNMLFLYVLSQQYISVIKISEQIYNSFRAFVDKFIVFKDDLKKEHKKHLFKSKIEYIDKLDEELKDIVTKTKQSITYILFNLIETILSNYFNSLDSINYTRYCQIYSSCVLDLYKKHYNMDIISISSKNISDYIFSFFENKASKLKDSIELDDFSNVNFIASYYQNIVIFLKNSNFEYIKQQTVNNNSNCFLNLFDYIKEDNTELIFTEDNEDILKLKKQISVENSKGVIFIDDDKKFKCCYSIFENIKFTFDTIKLSLIIDDIHQEQIYLQFIKIMLNVVNTSKVNIIDGKGYDKGIFKSISQNNILIYAANVSILRNIISIITIKLKQILKNPIIFELIEDLYKKLSNYLILARDKIYDMYYKKIQETITELKSYKFENYQVLEGDVNNYTKVVIFLLPKIYSASENCFEREDINYIISELLMTYFENLDSILPNKAKFKDESKAKQFKKDMFNLKKSMINFPSVETTWVKTKTDNYNKCLIPEDLIKKKK